MQHDPLGTGSVVHFQYRQDTFLKFRPGKCFFCGLSHINIEDMLEDVKEDPEQLVGMTLTTKDQVRLIPDILENDGDLFFPIFSSEEEMGEYGDNFSKVAQRLVDVIPLARNNEKELKGIVLNAFSEPFVLESVLFDLVENMKSRIELTGK